MPPSDPWTVGRLLNWTSGYLTQHGADSPRLDAEILLAEALQCERIELYTRFEVEPTEPQRTAFRELVRRRADGMPVAYLVGRREFYSLSFVVTPAVLIPRPETELIVMALLDATAEEPDREWTICDIGTGSGILAVCAAKHLPNSRVTAIDVSAEAIEVARVNAAAHDVAERVELLVGDLFEPIAPDRRFDFIVSNPPYVTEAELAELAVDVRDHEPRVALVSGPAGTEVLAPLITHSVAHLRPNGQLLIEINPLLHETIQKMIASRESLEALPTVKDGQRKLRVVHARRVAASNS